MERCRDLAPRVNLGSQVRSAGGGHLGLRPPQTWIPWASVLIPLIYSFAHSPGNLASSCSCSFILLSIPSTLRLSIRLSTHLSIHSSTRHSLITHPVVSDPPIQHLSIRLLPPHHLPILPSLPIHSSPYSFVTHTSAGLCFSIFQPPIAHPLPVSSTPSLTP